MSQNEVSITGITKGIYTITIDPTTQRYKPENDYEIGKISNSIRIRTGITISHFSKVVSHPLSYTWFGGTFDESLKNENWIYQSVFGIDFDKGTIGVDEVINRLKKHEIRPQVWYYTLSDSDSLRKFRVVLFLDEPVHKVEEHKIITTGLLKLFPEADRQCKNRSRFFFGGRESFVLDNQPNIKRNIIPILGTITISKDNGKTRYIPSYSAEHQEDVSLAPNQHLLYYNYKSCRFSPNLDNKKTTSIEGSTQKYQLDWSDAKNKIRILQEFLSGTWLYHNQLFGLATNLQYIRGGQKLMIDTMNKFNELGLTNYTQNNFNIFPYLKKVKYYPQLIKGFSPYPEDSDLYDIISATKELRGKIEVVDELKKIPLQEAERRFKIELDRVMKEGESGKIYFFKLPTAIGKTESLVSCVGTTIATPTNDLKNEISSRMKVVHHITPDRIVFESEHLNNLISYYYSIGLPQKSTAVLYDVINGNGLVKYSPSDLSKAKDYLENLKKTLLSNETILTTHTRALFSEFKNETIVFDEDPLNSILIVKSLEITDLERIENNTLKKIPSMDITINYLKSLIPGEIRKCPVLSVDHDELIEQISKIKINTDIFSFFDSSYLMRDPRTPNVVHYVIKKDIPVSKKVIILSATSPIYIYQKLYGDRVEIVDISDVEQMGEIIQHTSRSCSRNGLNNYHQDISKSLGDIPVITFKSFQKRFQNPVRDMYFGNCSGYDELKGKDIAVVGTPHRDNVQYLLTASILGIEFKTTDTTMTHQKIEYNGFRFWIKCYDHPELRNIQLSFIESDLVQAVGRARTLRTNAKVLLYSNFPLRVSTSFIY